MPRKHKLTPSLILRCVTHTLTDDPHFRQRSHFLLPQDACRTSWQVMCNQPNFNVSDKTQIMQTDANMQTHNQLSMHAKLFTKLQTDHSGFRAHETHRHVMQQKWKPVQKLMTADIETDQTRSHKFKFCPVRNRPKLWNSKTSQNCYSTPISAWQLFHHSFLHFSSQLSAASKPSTTTRPGTTIKKTYTLGGNLPVQTILWASAANLYNKLPFSSNSKAFIVPCQRYSLGLYFRRIPASAFWR